MSLLLSIKSGFSVYLQTNVIRVFFLGFSAGIPIMLVFSTLSIWLEEAGVQRSSIGFFSWITLVYAFKWAWAPVVDRWSLPVLSPLFGRRRSWLLLSQVCLVLAIASMGMIDPQSHLTQMALAALVVAFCSATQDIVIDAFRIESGETRQQGAMAASYMVGYRLAMIVATAGTLLLATYFQTESELYQYSSWRWSYFAIAAVMFVGIVATLMSPEPAEAQLTERLTPQPKSLIKKVYYSLVQPVFDLFERFKWLTLVLLILICTYRISDIVMGVMANVFYIDMGYTKQDIAAMSKTFGVVMTLLGAFFAGGLINRFGILKILLSGAILSAVTNILFIYLSQSEPSLLLLGMVIAVDNLSAGIAMAALIGFLSSITNKEFTATQYAWLSSAMLLLPKFLGGFSGIWLDNLGYTQFFTMTALIGIPAILCILYLIKKDWIPTKR